MTAFRVWDRIVMLPLIKKGKGWRLFNTIVSVRLLIITKNDFNDAADNHSSGATKAAVCWMMMLLLLLLDAAVAADDFNLSHM